MKVANIKAGSLNKQDFDSIFWHPCYYVAIEKGEKRKNWSWKIGCKKENESVAEVVFKIYKFGDINDDAVWEKLTGLDFAVNLIDAYRRNGTDGIKKLMKD